MAVYQFGKYVNITELQKELRSAGLDTYVSLISTSGNTVTITTKYSLSPYDEKTLRRVVIAHLPVDPLVAATQVRVLSAMDFGRSILTEYAAMNTLAKVPLPVIQQLLIQLLPIQLALQSGSLYTALDLLTKLPPSPYLNAKTVLYFTNKIRKYLGIPTI